MPVTENSENRNQIHDNKDHLSEEQMGGQISADRKDKSEDGCDSNCYLCHSKHSASKSAKKRRRRCENDTNNFVADKQIPLKKLRATELYENPSGRNSLMAAFFRLLDDDSIQDFLWMDACAVISDKYLLAMVYTYFKRAEVPKHEYNRMNFFVALYLANDMEEDDEDEKYDIFPWALGKAWRKLYPNFLLKRDDLWRRLAYRAVVSKQTCDEVMSIVPDHPIWKRNRRRHHGGAWREYMKGSSSEATSPRGPGTSPPQCPRCAQCGPEDESLATSDYHSGSAQSSPDERCSSSSFNMTGLKKLLNQTGERKSRKRLAQKK